MKNLKEQVLERITKGEFSMRSKTHFFLRGALYILLACLVLVFTVYLFSLSIFILHARGAFLMGGFGMRGLYECIMALPLTLLVCALLAVGIAEILARHFSFSYRRPLLYSLGALLGVVSILSGLVYITHTHERMRTFAETRHIPAIERLYKNVTEPPLRRGYPGIMKSTTTHGFILETFSGETLEVHLSPDTRMKDGALPAPNTEIFVGGERTGETINAFGVRTLDQKHPLHKKRMEKRDEKRVDTYPQRMYTNPSKDTPPTF